MFTSLFTYLLEPLNEHIYWRPSGTFKFGAVDHEQNTAYSRQLSQQEPIDSCHNVGNNWRGTSSQLYLAL